MQLKNIQTFGALKQAGYQPKTIKMELRENLIAAIQHGTNPFEGIYGYDDTVIPEIERAILSMHHIILLGLRGQAKTRIARLMVNLLDEYVPVIAGTVLNEDPFHPISAFGMQTMKTLGDEAPISWLHRSERYTEKLATPDVSVADLIGDVDPIKAAALKLSYDNEAVIHYGLIPRSNRCIFVLNELPDLQARIQVSLFNILQEGDIQIRGFKLRLPLDIQFMFTANPEDYTNRGSIVTPLKDRIDSQIITHYPKTIALGKMITSHEAKIQASAKQRIHVPELAKDLIEQIAMEARASEYVDAKSGVSARLTISALENLVSAAEQRSLKNKENATCIRVGDFAALIPSITGKIELVYEGEQEGSAIVAQNLIGKAIRKLFAVHFPEPEKAKKLKKENPYAEVVAYFSGGKHVDLMNGADQKTYENILAQVDGLKAVVEKLKPEIAKQELWFWVEFLLHGLSEYSLISKKELVSGFAFNDLFASMFSLDDLREEDEG